MFSPEQINVLSEYFTHSWLMRVDQQFTPLLTTPAEPNVVGRRLADIDHFSVLHLSILLEISPLEAADHWKDFKQHPGNSQIQGLAHYAALCGPSGLLWCTHAHVRMDSVDASGHTLFTSALNQCKSQNKRHHAFSILNRLASTDDFLIFEQPADLARKFFDSFGHFFKTHADSALRIANALIQVNAHHLTQDWIQHPHVKTARLVNDQFVAAPPSTIKNSVSKTLCVALTQISTKHNQHIANESTVRTQVEEEAALRAALS
jgi:hypothetical protein